MAQIINKSEECKIDGHKFHINLHDETDIDDIRNVKLEYYDRSYMIVADDVIRDPKDANNLITGINVSYICKIRTEGEKSDESWRIIYSLITNTGDIKEIESVVEKAANSQAFAKKPIITNVSELQKPFYRRIYPDFPVLEGSNQDEFPNAKLHLNDLTITREKVSVEPFHQFIDFIRQGALLKSPELSKAMAKAIESTIPTRQFALSGGQEASLNDSSHAGEGLHNRLLMDGREVQGVVGGEKLSVHKG